MIGPMPAMAAALIHAIAAEKLSVLIGDYTEKSGIAEHGGKDTLRHFGRGKVRRKVELLIQRREGVIADASANFGVSRLRTTDGGYFRSSPT